MPKITYSSIAKEIKEFSEYKRTFKATIKLRIKEGNGVEWIKEFSKSYDWERTLKEITAKSSVSEIENRLLENLKY